MLDNDEKKVYNLLVDNMSGLSYFKEEKYPNFLIFADINNDIIFRYHIKYKYSVVSAEKISPFFNDEIDIEVSDIKKLFKWWIELTLNLKPTDVIW